MGGGVVAFYAPPSPGLLLERRGRLRLASSHLVQCPWMQKKAPATQREVAEIAADPEWWGNYRSAEDDVG
eukprot:11767650-Alexandrium_andersonii.AAC.1